MDKEINERIIIGKGRWTALARAGYWRFTIGNQCAMKGKEETYKMKYKIRIAVPADEQKIRELFVEMMTTIYGEEDPDVYGEIYLADFWAGQEDRIYVAEDREVVAFLSVEVHHEPVKYIYLDDFSVTAAYRNQGIGSELIRTAESYARENRITAVLLHVYKTNESAMRFYERSGYSIYRDDGTRYLLKKDIPSS